jgi:hypothetical protein
MRSLRWRSRLSTRKADSAAVLILGNGVSRRAHHQLIESWSGEVWGANRVFLEYGHRLTRLAGHRECLEESKAHSAQHGHKYEIWGGNSGSPVEGARRFTVSPKWLRDTGTSLVAQALHERRRVVVCGFDLGGPDVHSPGLWRSDKRNWVRRWVEIFRTWGPDCVEWIGHDHGAHIRAVLAGRVSERHYARSYLRMRPHIPGNEYEQEYVRYMAEQNEPITTGGRAGFRDFSKDKRVQVQWANGYKSYLREEVARRFERRGRLRILGESKPAKSKPEVKSDDGATSSSSIGRSKKPGA